MNQYLIITADDCGLSEGINEETLRLHDAGLVTAASVIMNFPAARHALGLFRQRPSLEVGVHLTLSDGEPLTPLPASSELVDSDGLFRHQFLLYAQAIFPLPSLRRAVRDEMRAQIEAMLDQGIRPGHLTTHCHFHVFPALRDIVHDLAEEYRIRWVRNSSARASVVPLNPLLTLQPDPLPEQTGHFIVPNYLIGLKQWLSNTPAQLLEAVRELDGIVELIVHPDRDKDPGFPEHVRYNPQQRHRETRFLEDWFDLLRRQNDHDINPGNLLASSSWPL